jgi:hypothetical protein
LELQAQDQAPFKEYLSESRMPGKLNNILLTNKRDLVCGVDGDAAPLGAARQACSTGSESYDSSQCHAAAPLAGILPDCSRKAFDSGASPARC